MLIRLATFNILHGRSVHDGAVHQVRLVDSIKQLDPDILALQEVDCDQPRSGNADLTAVAAEAMGAVSHRFVAAINGTPGATWMAATGREQPGSARYGIALLSRFLASTWQVVRLPRIPMRFPMYLPAPRRVQIVHEEPRAAMIGRFDTPLGPLTVANTHLSFVPGWNRVQLRRLIRDLRGFPGPRVLMGDLNMDPPTPSRWTRMRSLGQAPAFPAHEPCHQVDHHLTDYRPFAVGEWSAPRLQVSGHRAVVGGISRD